MMTLYTLEHEWIKNAARLHAIQGHSNSLAPVISAEGTSTRIQLTGISKLAMRLKQDRDSVQRDRNFPSPILYANANNDEHAAFNRGLDCVFSKGLPDLTAPRLHQLICATIIHIIDSVYYPYQNPESIISPTKLNKRFMFNGLSLYRDPRKANIKKWRERYTGGVSGYSPSYAPSGVVGYSMNMRFISYTTGKQYLDPSQEDEIVQDDTRAWVSYDTPVRVKLCDVFNSIMIYLLSQYKGYIRKAITMFARDFILKGVPWWIDSHIQFYEGVYKATACPNDVLAAWKMAKDSYTDLVKHFYFSGDEGSSEDSYKEFAGAKGAEWYKDFRLRFMQLAVFYRTLKSVNGTNGVVGSSFFGLSSSRSEIFSNTLESVAPSWMFVPVSKIVTQEPNNVVLALNAAAAPGLYEAFDNMTANALMLELKG